MTECKEYYYNLIKRNGKRMVDVPSQEKYIKVY
jgi:hypothetical protein